MTPSLESRDEVLCLHLADSGRTLEGPLTTADSTDRRNTLAKAFSRCLEAERLPGAFVQPASDAIEFVLVNIRQVHPFWEVLAQQTVGVFVRSALPRLLRIAEVDLHVGRQREALMVCHLFATIPSQ